MHLTQYFTDAYGVGFAHHYQSTFECCFHSCDFKNICTMLENSLLFSGKNRHLLRIQAQCISGQEKRLLEFCSTARAPPVQYAWSVEHHVSLCNLSLPVATDFEWNGLRAEAVGKMLLPLGFWKDHVCLEIALFGAEKLPDGLVINQSSHM